MTKGRLLNACFIFILIPVVTVTISISVLKTNNVMVSESTEPTEALSISPAFSPFAPEWMDETMINIDVDREDINQLMGFVISISDDGNTFAVGGRETLNIYYFIHQSWFKVADSKKILLTANYMENLSYVTTICLSSNGENLIVGDELLRGVLFKGAVMMFSKAGNDQASEWCQLGSTIYDLNSARFGGHVAISDIGHRIAVFIRHNGSSYVGVYDYDGSDWTIKMEINKIEPLLPSSGSIALSSNGKFLVLQNTSHRTAEIYDLMTVTKFQI